MIFTIEPYKDEYGKGVFISEECASGADYPYETAEDIGKAVADYLDGYYHEVVENPDADEEE